MTTAFVGGGFQVGRARCQELEEHRTEERVVEAIVANITRLNGPGDGVRYRRAT